MENAVKALEYAFAMFVFVIALTASIYLISTARMASDTVFKYIDTKQYYVDVEMPEDELEANGNIKYNGRIVNVENIVATLYRDYKENYVIEFYNSDKQRIMRFDLSEENRTRQIWTGNPDVDVKKRLDLFLRGGTTGIINDQVHNLNTDIAFEKNIDVSTKNAIVTRGLYDYCKGKRFIEEYAYVPKEVTIVTEKISKIVIRYIEV